jgi:uncharacterized heparinase superfamily protein
LCWPEPDRAEEDTCRSFHESGYTVARIGATPEASVLFDHGPLGMPPSFGHGHADALSLLLRFAGQEIFIDTGTYTYTGDPEWRRHFRATRAHNTVTVDERDQADQQGSFIWSRPYEARLVAREIQGSLHGRLLAAQNGYEDIGVRHTRGIAWSADQWLLVWDRLEGRGNHKLELNWHLGITAREQTATRYTLDTHGGALQLQCSGGESRVHCGDQQPRLGWRSKTYGVLEPAPVVSCRYHGALPHEFTTLVVFPGQTATASDTEDALRWMRQH